MPETNSLIKDNYVFGLDIGTRTVIGIVGYQTLDRFKIVADYVLEHDTRAMLDGQIHDIASVAQTIKKVKHELEKQLGFTLERVSIAAAGRVLVTKMIHVEQEVDSNTAIDEERVYALELLGIEKAHQEVNQSLGAHDTGYHCVGYTVSKYYLNDYEISNLVGHKGKSVGADVLATFLPQEVVESLHQVVAMADLQVHNLTLEPIAAIQVAIPSQYRLLNIALVDIGAGTSDIAITKGGSVIAYGMIPLAGDELTEAIVHSLLVDFKTAEMIKIKSSTKCKQISYKDIMGVSHKINREDVDVILKDASENLAKKIGDKIIELNGGSPTNAVFVVGGGGQLTQFTDVIADYMGISRERVALRGKAVLDNVEFASSRKKTPDLVTPVGICFSAFGKNRHEFVQVYLNDEPIKVFDTNNLTVMDIAAYKGLDPKSLITTRGKELNFYLNGLPQHIRGEVGEPAKIMINNKLASLNDRISMNDYVTIIPAKKGKDAALSTNQLTEQINPICVNVDGVKHYIKPKLLCNSKPVVLNYDIQNDDKIETIQPTIKELFNMLDLNYSGSSIQLNGLDTKLDTPVMDGDYILTQFNQQMPESLVKEEIQESENKPSQIHVNVNGEEITLEGKDSYVFVDIFNVYSFDLSKPQGIVECEINGKKANYMDEIKDKDVLKVYWSKT